MRLLKTTVWGGALQCQAQRSFQQLLTRNLSIPEGLFWLCGQGSEQTFQDEVLPN